MSIASRCCAALAALTLTLIAPALAHAQAPQLHTQVPGYYRQMVGQIEVTALYDGQIMLDAKLLRGSTPAQVQQLLARHFRANPTPTAVMAYLVNTGSHLILIDAGAASLFGPGMGQVLRNLQASGYDAQAVDTVLLTHLHGDHVGGLVDAQGQPAFPKATVYAAKAEADHWLNPAVAARAPAPAQPFFKMAQDSLAPYVKAGAFKTFEGGAEVLPGVRAVDEPGHTPGHTGYLLSSGQAQLLVWGDVVHNAAVQFAHPRVTVEFDVNQPQALATRLKLLAWTARERLLVAGAHLPFPGLGHVRADAKGQYSWVPVDFAPLPVEPAK